MPFVSEIVSSKNPVDGDKFLTGIEISKYQSLKFEKRRLDWLRGRFAAKKAIIAVSGVNNYKDIEISNDCDRKPYFEIGGVKQKNTLSISHCSGYAASAVAREKNTLLGIDVEIIEKRSRAWVEDFFDHKETTGDNPLTLTTLWTQKEAVLKALGVGLSVDLRQLVILGNKPIFSGKLMDIWEKNGAKNINLISYPIDDEHIVSVAYSL